MKKLKDQVTCPLTKNLPEKAVFFIDRIFDYDALKHQLEHHNLHPVTQQDISMGMINSYNKFSFFNQDHTNQNHRDYIQYFFYRDSLASYIVDFVKKLYTESSFCGIFENTESLASFDTRLRDKVWSNFPENKRWKQVCPISLEIIVDPVNFQGRTYERDNLVRSLRINSIVPHSGQHLNLGVNRLDQNNTEDRVTIETHLIHTDVNMKESLENFRKKYNLDLLIKSFEQSLNKQLVINNEKCNDDDILDNLTEIKLIPISNMSSNDQVSKVIKSANSKQIDKEVFKEYCQILKDVFGQQNKLRNLKEEWNCIVNYHNQIDDEYQSKLKDQVQIDSLRSDQVEILNSIEFDFVDQICMMTLINQRDQLRQGFKGKITVINNEVYEKFIKFVDEIE